MDDFDDYYRKRASALRRYAAAIVGPGDADDACQDAWLRIWRSWDDADPDRRDAWAFRVARNSCLDRRRRARPTDPLDEARLPPIADFSDAVHTALD
ncbi:MAG: sigma-70 family RNA polymerase sigma factor, partial [Acidimicrobiales bacterium]|nr:sigma-70 family RNA polymerase sigma factor [Acidimicrobiales bacterium]